MFAAWILAIESFFTSEAPAVELPRSLHDQQPTDFDRHSGSAKGELNAFPIGEANAKAVTLGGIFAGRFPRCAWPARASRMQWVSRAGPGRICVTLRPCAFAEKNVGGGNVQSVKLELAMTAMFFWSHNRNAADNPPAGLILVKLKRP